MRRRCCCKGDQHEFGCTESVPYDSCDEGLLTCLQDMAAVMEVTFSDCSFSEGEEVYLSCAMSDLDGGYFIDFDETIEEEQLLWLIQKFYNMCSTPEGGDCGFLCGFAMIGFIGGEPTYSEFNWKTFKNLSCEDGKLCIEVGYGALVDGAAYTPLWSARGCFDLPISVESGLSFELTPDDYGVGDEHPCRRPPLLTCSIKFLGRPCESVDDNCPGPIADFYLDNGPAEGGPCVPCTPEEINQGCVYEVASTVEAGQCDIVECYWSDGWIGCGERDPIIIEGCGTHEGNVTLVVVDSSGCIGKKTKTYECCNCCEPTGGASVSLIGPCKYRFIFSEGETTCGSDQVLYCVTNLGGTDDCHTEQTVDCTMFGPGTQEIEICEDTHIEIWAVDCKGCTSLVLEDDLECTQCVCCSGPLSGFLITLSGIVGGEEFGDDCDCGSGNGSYNVPKTDESSCFGFLVDEDRIHCDSETSGVFDIPVAVDWLIYCDETGYWIRVQFAIEESSGESGSVDIFLGLTMPVCEEISGSYEFEISNPGIETFCKGPVTLAFEAYSSC